MRPEDIKQLIETGLKESKAIINSEDGVHFSATIISPAFTGLSRIQKQQLVYSVLQSKIADNSIHAISMKTLTPEEWEATRESNHG